MVKTVASQHTDYQTRSVGARLNDRAVIMIVSPALGIFVAWASGMLHDGPASGWQLGLSILFLSAMAFLIWYGNRGLFFWLRDRANVASTSPSPRRRIVIMIGAAVAFTAPSAYVALTSWYLMFVPDGVNGTAVLAATALVTVTSLFFAHAYEAILLVREQAQHRVSFGEIEQQRLEAEVRALESQLDPHFIYNALCSLGFLIETNRSRAGDYVARLSGVYAYVTQNFTARLVDLDEELGFARAFAELLKLRHAEAIRISIPENAAGEKRMIVPMSIQLALDNAAKHNDMTREKPLRVDVSVLTDCVEIVNNKQALAVNAVSHGIGLPNLSSRCRLCVGRDTVVVDAPDMFLIQIPLKAAA